MTLRFGLVGAGRWGRVYIETCARLEPTCRITTVATSRPAALGIAARTVADWRSVVTSRDCDAIIIASPPATHPEILEACIAAGKPCIVEKPLALDLATTERLHVLVSSKHAIVLVNHTQLFNPVYRALKAALWEEAPIRLIWAERLSFGPFDRATPVLWDFAPHEFSLLLDLFGCLPDRVDALSAHARDAVATVTTVKLTYGRASAVLVFSNAAPERRRQFRAFTSEHMFSWNDDVSPKLVAFSAPSAEPGRIAAQQPEGTTMAYDARQRPMEIVISHFLAAIANGPSAQLGTQMALDVARILSSVDEVLVRRPLD